MKLGFTMDEIIKELEEPGSLGPAAREKRLGFHHNYVLNRDKYNYELKRNNTEKDTDLF